MSVNSPTFFNFWRKFGEIFETTSKKIAFKITKLSLELLYLTKFSHANSIHSDMLIDTVI